MKSKLLIIAGPTAIGKTELSIKLAKTLNTSIISADSMQIYKYMDIGSAKVTKDEMNNIPHYMIDIIDPKESFSVSQYKELATNKIDNIIKEKKIPIVVGGTGLYLDSLTCNMNFSNTDKNESYRIELEELAIQKGNEYLHSLLKEIDFKSYQNIHPNNRKRVIRALEVYKTTNKPFSSYNSGDNYYKSKYDIMYYILTTKREKLYERINNRVDMMMDLGLLEECKNLKQRGYTSNLQSMQGIGYKEILYYLEGKYTLDDAINKIKQGSRNYAKRQLTWFRKDPRAKFIDKDTLSDEKIFNLIITELEGNNVK